MKKRIIAGLLAIVILCTVLGGCGGQKANSTDRNTPMSQESVVTEKNDTVIDSQTQSEISQETQPEKTAEEEEAEMTEVSYNRVSVHDPSVAYDNGTYYIFGSHMAWAKSTDLRNWESFQMNINSEYANLFGKEWEEY